VNLPGELARLVEGNAWTFGPVATALRVLDLTVERGADPEEFWEPLLEQCPRMAPLGYWREARRSGGHALGALREDCLRRVEAMAGQVGGHLPGSGQVLIVGHDAEIDALLSHEWPGREFRYLVLEGSPDVESPGTHARRRFRPAGVRLGPPFGFPQLEEALDWADVAVLAGMVIHRQNLLGPPQLRPFLASAREQVDRVILCAVNERRMTLGEGSPRRYSDDFRPYLWQTGVTHLVSEWPPGRSGTSLGWLPMPPDEPDLAPSGEGGAP